jgi:hypothetical protein
MKDNTSDGEVEASRVDMDAARLDVVESENEIQEIKSLLRQITSSNDVGKLAVSVLEVWTCSCKYICLGVLVFLRSQFLIHLFLFINHIQGLWSFILGRFFGSSYANDKTSALLSD